MMRIVTNTLTRTINISEIQTNVIEMMKALMIVLIIGHPGLAILNVMAILIIGSLLIVTQGTVAHLPNTTMIAEGIATEVVSAINSTMMTRMTVDHIAVINAGPRMTAMAIMEIKAAIRAVMIMTGTCLKINVQIVMINTVIAMKEMVEMGITMISGIMEGIRTVRNMMTARIVSPEIPDMIGINHGKMNVMI
jgi:hypothetical protein